MIGLVIFFVGVTLLILVGLLLVGRYARRGTSSPFEDPE